MARLRLRMPSASMVVALTALVVALGGTSYAAFGPFKGDKIIKKHSLSGNKLKNKTLTGTQINLKKLGTVPNASAAGTATVATTAGNSNALGGLAPSAYAGSAQPAFIAATLNAGFANLGTISGDTYNTAGYMKDTLGFVHLHGAFTCPTGDVAAFTLPAGYRPVNETVLPMEIANHASSYAIVLATGVVSTDNTAGASASCAIDGDTFRADGNPSGSVSQKAAGPFAAH